MELGEGRGGVGDAIWRGWLDAYITGAMDWLMGSSAGLGEEIQTRWGLCSRCRGNGGGDRGGRRAKKRRFGAIYSR